MYEPVQFGGWFTLYNLTTGGKGGVGGGGNGGSSNQ